MDSYISGQIKGSFRNGTPIIFDFNISINKEGSSHDGAKKEIKRVVLRGRTDDINSKEIFADIVITMDEMNKLLDSIKIFKVLTEGE